MGTMYIKGLKTTDFEMAQNLLTNFCAVFSLKWLFMNHWLEIRIYFNHDIVVLAEECVGLFKFHNNSTCNYLPFVDFNSNKKSLTWGKKIVLP